MEDVTKEFEDGANRVEATEVSDNLLVEGVGAKTMRPGYPLASLGKM